MADAEWDALCSKMESESSELRDFMATWGRHCGAPRAVFLGHLCKLLQATNAEAERRGMLRAAGICREFGANMRLFSSAEALSNAVGAEASAAAIEREAVK